MDGGRSAMNLGKLLALAAALIALGACESSTGPTNAAAKTPDATPAAQAATSDKVVTVDRGATTAVRQKIGWMLSLNPDCSANGTLTMRIIAPPAHGQVAFAPGQDYPGFGKDSLRSACNAKLSPTTEIFYTSEAGYVGADRTVIEAVTADGVVGREEYRIAVSSLPSTPVAAPPQGKSYSYLRGATSGTRQKIDLHYDLNPDCTASGRLVARVVGAPANGQLAIEEGKDYPNYDKDNTRFDCNKKLVPVTLVYYTSNAGYSGTDTASIEVVFTNGELRTYTYAITVR